MQVKRVKQRSLSAVLANEIHFSYSFYGPTGECTGVCTNSCNGYITYYIFLLYFEIRFNILIECFIIFFAPYIYLAGSKTWLHFPYSAGSNNYVSVWWCSSDFPQSKRGTLHLGTHPSLLLHLPFQGIRLGVSSLQEANPVESGQTSRVVDFMYTPIHR